VVRCREVNSSQAAKARAAALRSKSIDVNSSSGAGVVFSDVVGADASDVNTAAAAAAAVPHNAAQYRCIVQLQLQRQSASVRSPHHRSSYNR